LIANSTAPEQRGRAFGFHRSMDHAGAVIAPLLAFALPAAKVDLTHVFFASAIPGVLVLLLFYFGLPAGQKVEVAAPARFSWGELHGRLQAMIVAAGLLALASVPEAFVVLWARQAGMEVVWIPLVWAAASLAKMGTAMPAGILSDRLGRMPLLLTGWSARSSTTTHGPPSAAPRTACITSQGLAAWRDCSSRVTSASDRLRDFSNTSRW